MRFEIKRAKNGYIVQCDSEEYPNVSQEVSDGIMDDEVDAWACFLRELNFEYGPSTNKYSKKRLYVEIRPGLDCEDAWIKHTVILQFKKGILTEDEYYWLLWKTEPLIMEIPGVREYNVFRNDSKYVPEDISGFGVEIIFENQKALDLFMEHPKHFEANALFEKYLAEPPYMVLTHRVR